MTVQTPAAPPSGARNADLADLAALLRDQQARKADFVAPAAAIRAHSGQLVIDDSAPMIGPDGVTMTSGVYTPTDVCDQGIADKLAIPAAYLRRLREQKPGLYDANVNGWLAGDDRKFLLRCLRSSGPGGGGVVRAFLSDGYKIIDNLDVLLAVLDGVRQAGTPVHVDGCDLTDRRMYIRVVCEQVQALAPALLAGYRSPFTGASGADNPAVVAGFMITNSETGGGVHAGAEAGGAGLPERADHHPGRHARRPPRRAPRRGSGHLVGQHPGQDPRPDHRENHRRRRRVPGPLLCGRGAARDREGRRAASRRPAGSSPDRVAETAIHRRPAGRDPDPLHPRRGCHRRWGDARGHQRRADPSGRRRRA